MKKVNIEKIKRIDTKQLRFYFDKNVENYDTLHNRYRIQIEGKYIPLYEKIYVGDSVTLHNLSYKKSWLKFLNFIKNSPADSEIGRWYEKLIYREPYISPPPPPPPSPEELKKRLLLLNKMFKKASIGNMIYRQPVMKNIKKGWKV